jgi:uncharacterized protein YndB with AHSA1/START domain
VAGRRGADPRQGREHLPGRRGHWADGLVPFCFCSSWDLDARPAAVYAVLTAVEDYPRWWPQVREVHRIDACTGTARIRSVVPYDLAVAARRRRQDPEAGVLEIDMSGDLEGWARWTVTAHGPGARALFVQEVVARKPLLRRLAVPGRPVFRANHALMMRAGRRGLRWLLAAHPARPVRGLEDTARDLYCSRRAGEGDLAGRAISSAGERFVHTEEVTGSIPVSPTSPRPDCQQAVRPRSFPGWPASPPRSVPRAAGPRSGRFDHSGSGTRRRVPTAGCPTRPTPAARRAHARGRVVLVGPAVPAPTGAGTGRPGAGQAGGSTVH